MAQIHPQFVQPPYRRITLTIAGTPEILRQLTPLMNRGKLVPIGNAPDILIVNVEGTRLKVGTRSKPREALEISGMEVASLRLPAAFHPLDAIGEWDVSLLGGMARISLRGGKPAHSAEEWAEVVANVRGRNRALKLVLPRIEPISTAPAKMPSALVALQEVIPSTHTKITKRIAALTTRTTIQEIPVDEPGILQRHNTQITVDLASGDRPLQAHLPFDHPAGAITGPASDLARLCIERLARFDSDTYFALLSLIDIAMAHNNPVLAIGTAPKAAPDAAPVSWLDLGKRRGWLELDKYHRGQRLRESIDLLTSIHFTIDLKSRGNLRLSNVPLFTHQGDVEQDVKGQPKRVGVLVALNALLWKVMVDEQRATLYDRAILAADLRHEEWAGRIYIYLSGRWSMSWQHDQLFLKQGKMTHRLGTLLDGAGLNYQDQLAQKGPAWLRDKVKDALARLAKKKWGEPAHALIGKWTLTHGESVLADAVTVWATDAAVGYLNGSRPASLAAVKTRLARPEGKG